jgi:hypothetical protein
VARERRGDPSIFLGAQPEARSGGLLLCGQTHEGATFRLVDISLSSSLSLMSMTSGFGGIVIRLGGGDPLEGRTASSQTVPAKSYVYGHFNTSGDMFYVGKGFDRRAWDQENRHTLWHRYVKRHLAGQYVVRILADNLSDEEAEILESEVMADRPDKLVNWVNWGRMDDFTLIDQYHRKRNANRARIASIKALEKEDLEAACVAYKEVILKTAEYAFTVHESGIVGQLMREEREEFGWSGEAEALERLVMCLLKLGKLEEASNTARDYFTTYRMDANLKAFERTQTRIAKAKNRMDRQGHAAEIDVA